MVRMMNYIGIEIGATKLQVAAGDSNARLLDVHRMPTNQHCDAHTIREQIAAIMPRFIQQYRPVAAGVGFGGPVDHKTGGVADSFQVGGWTGFDLKHWAEDLMGLPVVVENDSNASALAEARVGAGRNHRGVFYTNFGSGVGGGMVVNGHLYHGAKPGESEMGHLRLDKTGVIVEERCSGWAVDGKVRRHIAEHPGSLLARLAGNTLRGEAKFLGPALAQGDEAARAIVEETANDIAFALSHVCHLFHPEIIVLGGGLSLLGEPLRASVARQLPPFLMNTWLPGPPVALSALGETVVCVGAVLLAGDL